MGSGVPAIPGRARLSLRRALLPLAAAAAWFAGAPPAVAQQPPADAVAPSHAAAIRELIAASGALDREVARVDAVVAQMRVTTPDLPDAVWDDYAARLRDREALLARYVPVYARHLDEQDTRALAAFYRSPFGRRVLAAQAAIAADTRGASEQLVRDALAGDPVTVPVQASGTSQSHTAAIRELIDAMGAVPAAQETMRRTVATLRTAPALRGIEPAEWDRLGAALTDSATLLAIWVPAYERHLPEPDARRLTAFYLSPLGRRVAAALPAIQSDLAAVAQDYGVEAARRAVREVLGPLPQWRPAPARPAAPAPAPAPAPTVTAPAPPTATAPAPPTR